MKTIDTNDQAVLDEACCIVAEFEFVLDEEKETIEEVPATAPEEEVEEEDTSDAEEAKYIEEAIRLANSTSSLAEVISRLCVC